MQGALWEGVLPGVLRSLYVGRRTGVLSFVREDQRCGVRFRLGNILSADTSMREYRLGETLVRQGRLTPVDLKRAMGFSPAGRQAARRGAHGPWASRRAGARRSGHHPGPPGPEARLLVERRLLRVPRGADRPGSRRRRHAPAVDRRADPAGGAKRPGPRRRSLQPRRHRPDPVALGRPAASLPAHQPEPRRRLRALARGRHAERARSHADHPVAVGGRAAQPLRPSLHGGARVPAPSPQRRSLPCRRVRRGSRPPLHPRVPLWERRPWRSRPWRSRPWRSRAVEEPPAVEDWRATLPPADEPPPTQVWPTLAELGGFPQAASSDDLPATQVWPTLAELGGFPRETSSDEPPPTQVWPTLDELGAPGEMASPGDSAPTQRLAPVDTRRLEVLEAYDGLAFVRTSTSSASRETPPRRRCARPTSVWPSGFTRTSTTTRRCRTCATSSRRSSPVSAKPTRCSATPAFAQATSGIWPGRRERRLVRSSRRTLRAEREAATEAIDRGSESLAQERYWEAIRLFESAIPRAEGALKQKARVLLARAYAKNPGWVKQGEELLLAVLREEPDNLDALLHLGRIYKGQGLRSRAHSTLRRVLELSPAHEEARHLIGELGP